MVATFNGWDDMPEIEREALERWEQQNQRRSATWALRTWWMATEPASSEMYGPRERRG
jgi:hypothetical protein